MSSGTGFVVALDLLRASHDEEIAILHAEIERLRAAVPEENGILQLGILEDSHMQRLESTDRIQRIEQGPVEWAEPVSEDPTEKVLVEKTSTEMTFSAQMQDSWRTWHTSGKSRAASILEGDAANHQSPKTRLLRFVLHPSFESMFALLIVFNIVFMAIEMQHDGIVIGMSEGFSKTTWLPGSAQVFEASHWFFGIVFTLEIVLKLMALHCRFFESGMNWLDLVIVAFWIASVSGLSIFQMGAARIFRFIRIMRMVKMLRALQHFDALFVITTATRKSTQTLAWVIVIFSALLSMFAAVQCSILSEFYIQDPSQPLESRQEVYLLFGTFTRSMFTMFELTLGNWPPVSRILSNNVSEWYALLTVLFKLTVGFGMVGVINGVFIQETFKASARDYHIMTRQKDREDNSFLQTMRRLFEVVDPMEESRIRPELLQRTLKDPYVKKWMEVQGLPAMTDVDTLFTLLDKDNDGFLSKEELLDGFATLKGPARHIDLKLLMNEVQLLHNELKIERRRSELAKVNLIHDDATAEPDIQAQSQRSSRRSEAAECH